MKLRLVEHLLKRCQFGRLGTMSIKPFLRKITPRSILQLKLSIWTRWRDRHAETRLLEEARRNSGGKLLTMSFYPGRPRPGAVIREIAAELGMRVRRGRTGKVVFFWPSSEDVFPPQPEGRINYRCTNIEKDLVDNTFAELAGYSIAIDPRTFVASYVRKAKRNAAHDGVVFDHPTAPEPGYVYQRLIDNVFSDEIEEIRVIVIGRVLDFVYVKRRLIADRFLVPNRSVTVVDTEAVLSRAEVELIEECARRIGLECGEIDVLRDRTNGRIYVIDINRTPSGPPRIFTPEQAKAVVVRMADAFREAFPMR